MLGSNRETVMSDVTHSRKAEELLLELKNNPDAVDQAEVALLHATLAAPRALREIDTTIRHGFDKVADNIKGPPPTQLVLLEALDGQPLRLNASQLVTISPYSDETTAVSMTDGHMHVVKGTFVDVSATIFQVVGSW